MPALLLTDADWHIYTSVNQATIRLDDGLAPLQCQAIIWTNRFSAKPLSEPMLHYCE